MIMMHCEMILRMTWEHGNKQGTTWECHVNIVGTSWQHHDSVSGT
jgi:hypothetical protein